MADFTGTAGDDVITGTSGDDAIDVSQGGDDIVNGGGGIDIISFGASFTSADRVDGGGVNDLLLVFDEIRLEGDYSAGLTLAADTINNIDDFFLLGAFNYKFSMNDGNVAAGRVFNISNDGSALSLVFDGSAESDGAFSIFDTRFSDNVLGGGGNDIISDGNGDDILNGGGGRNQLIFSNDQVAGGITVSLLLQGAPQDLGPRGIDTLSNFSDLAGTDQDDSLTGDDNANWLWGNGGSDTVSGNDGDDLIQIGRRFNSQSLGTDNADGGGGNDTISFYNSRAFSNVTFSLASQGSAQVTGVDTVTASNFENVIGGKLNDTLTGNGDNNILYGDSGSDTLTGGDGNDTLYGDKGLHQATGFGDDPLVLTDAAVPGDDTLIGGTGNDTLDGGLGNDTVSYAGEFFVIRANLQDGQTTGTWTDTLVSIENVISGNGNDFLFGDDNANILDGGPGDDVIADFGGNDTLRGGAGHDNLFVGAGDDSVDGGLDGGAADYGSDTAGIVGSLATGIVTGTLAGHDTLTNIDVLRGGSGNDILTGSDGSDSLSGAGGNDTLNGEGGQDGLDGGSGDDLLIGGPGGETWWGGKGIDALDLTFDTAGISIHYFPNNAATVEGSGVGDASLRDVEILKLGSGNDVVKGSKSDNVFVGGNGNDALSGGAGDDTLNGGNGADKLQGSGDVDTFAYEQASDSLKGSYDKVRDFVTGTDRISLWFAVNEINSDVSAAKLSGLAGAADAGHLGVHDALLAHIGSDTYLVIDANGVAGYQADNDLLIRVNGTTSIHIADFVTG